MTTGAGWPRGTARAIARSLDIYYRDTARIRRMDALNARFVRPGALVFDIGAHLGDRTASYLRLGASVVALEPQPQVFRALRLLHRRAAKATLIRAAAGAAVGEVEFHVNSANPTVSTASQALTRAAPAAPEWQGQKWDRRIRVPVTTLDRLIARYGQPDFIKIDVEGYEHEVLRGLDRPVPALSFEFTTLQRDVARACLDRLCALGRYEFNLSLGERHRLRPGEWMAADAVRRIILDLPDAANSGDVYARLR